jgi:DHA1 family multidrug resistance protein-like MFS transporter
MSTLIQDSVVGQAIRILTKGRFFKYAEEKDPSLWQQYINLEKSGEMAHKGRIAGDRIPDEDVLTPTQPVSRIPSTAWEHRGHRFQGLTGVRINPEHGKDVSVVEWWDENDSEVWNQSILM